MLVLPQSASTFCTGIWSYMVSPSRLVGLQYANPQITSHTDPCPASARRDIPPGQHLTLIVHPTGTGTGTRFAKIMPCRWRSGSVVEFIPVASQDS